MNLPRLEQKLRDRQREQGLSDEHRFWFITPEDVMDILGCGRRTAWDYVHTIMTVVTFS
jgi:hypothetical protein